MADNSNNNGRRNNGAIACEPQRQHSNVVVGVPDDDNDGPVDSSTSFLADGGSFGIPADAPGGISSFGAYLRSSLVIELGVCSFILVLSLLVEYSGIIAPRQRPIPYQQLQSTGDYVINQVYNESFRNDTIPSKFTINVVVHKRNVSLSCVESVYSMNML